MQNHWLKPNLDRLVIAYINTQDLGELIEIIPELDIQMRDLIVQVMEYYEKVPITDGNVSEIKSIVYTYLSTFNSKKNRAFNYFSTIILSNLMYYRKHGVFCG